MDNATMKVENERLKASWNCFSSGHLETYLCIEEQDQRINTHSILTRALLAEALWPGKFDALINEELRFGVVMTWIMQELKFGTRRSALLDELNSPMQDQRIPRLILETSVWLQAGDCPVLDYISEALMFKNSDLPDWYLAESAMNTFSEFWSTQLSDLASGKPKVLEIACGSGNDYKAIRDSGLGAHIAYSGLDICEKNISNAQRLYPNVDFFESSVLNSGLPDNSYDYIYMHDILGHLSPAGMEIAIKEIMRIVRKEAWVHCFNVADIGFHETRPFDSYFRNRLSISQFTASFEQAGASVEAVSVSDMLGRKFGYIPDYTSTSGSFIARKNRVV